MRNVGESIGGILLAGGKSRRMGREKGTLSLAGRKLYEYPLRVMESICDEILISSCNQNDIDFPHPVLCDEVEGLGPLGGILTCLKQAKHELNLVLSYDMPLVSKPLAAYLLDQSGDCDMVVPGMRPERPEPLCAFYRKSLIPVMEAQIEKQEYAVHKLIPLVNSSFVLIEEGMPFFQPDLFLNINRPDDLALIQDGE